jgi:hypothetical protein
MEPFVPVEYTLRRIEPPTPEQVVAPVKRVKAPNGAVPPDVQPVEFASKLKLYAIWLATSVEGNKAINTANKLAKENNRQR